MYAETPESRATLEQHALEQRLGGPLGANLGAPDKGGAAPARRCAPRASTTRPGSAASHV